MTGEAAPIVSHRRSINEDRRPAISGKRYTLEEFGKEIATGIRFDSDRLTSGSAPFRNLAFGLLSTYDIRTSSFPIPHQRLNCRHDPPTFR